MDLIDFFSVNKEYAFRMPRGLACKVVKVGLKKPDLSKYPIQLREMVLQDYMNAWIDAVRKYGRRPTKEEVAHMESSIRNSGQAAVPAPRLVGIELNPGPAHKKNKALAQKTTTTTTLVQQKKRRPRRAALASPNPLNRGLGLGQRNAAMDYIKTLVDPWEYPPMKLGYDCYVPSLLGMGYLRNSLTVNADGSFAIAFQPSITSSLITNVSGAAGVTWGGPFSLTDASSVTTQMSEARVVSGGLRVMALFPATSAPGVLYTGSDTSRTLANFQAASVSSLTGLPSSEIGIGSKGSRAVFYPIDNESFKFTVSPLTSYSGSVLPYQPTLYVAGLGFPTGTVVYYEAVLNLEGLPQNSSLSIGVDNNAAAPPTLVDSFPSTDSLVSVVKRLIPPSVIMDGIGNLASGLAGMIGGPLAKAGVNFLTSAFSSGAHVRRTLAAGASQPRHGRQNTVVIEEMKDNEYAMVRRH